MNSKKRLLKDSYLYIIIDKMVTGKRSIFNLINMIRDLDIDIIQFRDKYSKREIILRDAIKLRKLLLNSKAIFIVNDYLDIAKIVDSDGIHLGQDDLSIEIVRKILGKDKVVGISCHNLKQAIAAQNKGADYISIGPIFSTSTKPEYRAIGLDLIEELKRKIKIPFFGIGGINENNINQVLSSGVKRVAICKAISQVRDAFKTTQNIRKILGN